MKYLLKLYVICLLISFMLVSIIWQFAEVSMGELAQKLYAALGFKPLYAIEKVDQKGIPIQICSGGTTRYNPLFIARFAQRKIRSGDPQDRDAFIQASDWLIANATITDKTMYNYYTFGIPEYNIEPPWASALAQAVILNVLYQRYHITQDERFLSLARKVLNTLDPKLSNLADFTGANKIWFREYPTADPPFVLNGMLSVLFELHDYHQATQDSLALSLFNSGYETIIEKLPAFDKEGFSFYDLKGAVAGRLYHQKHIAQIKQLNAIKAHPILDHFQKRWSKADALPVALQMLINPKPMRILFFALAIFILSDLLLLGYILAVFRFGGT